MTFCDSFRAKRPEAVSSRVNELIFLMGLLRFATQTYVGVVIEVYQIPRYQLSLLLLRLKNPSSKVCLSL